LLKLLYAEQLIVFRYFIDIDIYLTNQPKS